MIFTWQLLKSRSEAAAEASAASQPTPEALQLPRNTVTVSIFCFISKVSLRLFPQVMEAPPLVTSFKQTLD